MTHVRIVNGPSKFDLMVSLFDGDCNHRREVKFHTERPEKSPHRSGLMDYPIMVNTYPAIVINGIERESGGGENWNFQGFLLGVDCCNVKGYYSTQTREGWLEREK